MGLVPFRTCPRVAGSLKHPKVYEAHGVQEIHVFWHKSFACMSHTRIVLFLWKHRNKNTHAFFILGKFWILFHLLFKHRDAGNFQN